MEIRGERFVDEVGRRLILRGANLGGSSKFPYKPDGRSFRKEGFYEDSDLSFVGRPFPLEEADAHFERLSRWGLRFERFLVTWEAVEHAGPGIYDQAYLEYVEAIVAKAASRGVSLFIDPHQDVWSRWTGGDGAPRWTLEALGFEPRNLHASGAAMLHQEMGADYPRMQWFSNYSRLACATMFTVFFGGDDFAPGIRIEGEGVQEYLVSHYIEAMRRIAERLAPYPNVVGFDSLNEPGAGFIGMPDLRLRKDGFAAMGPAPTPFEAMLAGEGLATEVDILGVRGFGLGKTGRTALGIEGTRAWRDGETCVWRRAGLWTLEDGRAKVEEPDWFVRRALGGKGLPEGLGTEGRYEAFNDYYLKPFVERFARTIRGAAKGADRFAIFVEGVPESARPGWADGAARGLVNATHWYDTLTLTMKLWTGFLAIDTEHMSFVFGARNVRRYFAKALARLAAHSRDRMGGVPTLLGEFGLPFDLNGRRAFRSGDYRLHEKALAAYYDAIDANLLDSTIWNYTADNSHELGDGWNDEDLSIFCVEPLAGAAHGPGFARGGTAGVDRSGAPPSETGDPRDSGGRALRGFVRPYALATAGDIQEMSFDLRSGLFRLRYFPDRSVRAATEVFVPRLQYPRGFRVVARGCAVALCDTEFRSGGSVSAAPGFDFLEGLASPSDASPSDASPSDVSPSDVSPDAVPQAVGVSFGEAGEAADWPLAEPLVLALAAEPGAAECVLELRRR